MSTSRKGMVRRSHDCSTRAGVSMLDPMLTSSLQISSANRDASFRSSARSFSCNDRYDVEWVIKTALYFTLVDSSLK